MFNNVTLIGYLGSDPESRKTRNNSTLTVLSLATKRIWKNRETGARESRTTWHKCVSFGRTAEYAATLTKGAHVQIVGEIQTRDFVAEDGAKKSVTEIRVHRIAHLDRPAKAESTQEQPDADLPTGSIVWPSRPTDGSSHTASG
jgi:single-strand DNA-binding protein